MSKVLVAGVGMCKFSKPSEGASYTEMGGVALKAALKDAGIAYGDIRQAYASYMYGDTCCGQRVLYEVGMTGIPVFNLNNACSSGSSGLFLARQAVKSGAVDCALALGFEQMRPGAIGNVWDDRDSPWDHWERRYGELDCSPAPIACRMFGAAGEAYLEKYGASPELFAQVAVKSRQHAAYNPYAVFRDPITVDDVMNAPLIYGDCMTRLMACPPTCGAAAVIVCSESFAERTSVPDPVEIVAQALATDLPETWKDPINLSGYDMARRASRVAYEQAGISPADVDVVELHDCFTPNEVTTYEALGLCEEGGAADFVARGDNTYGGKFVVNPSGGLMSKGHPIGATGLAQCCELVNQLRDNADKRQVEGARVALQHNLGLGGAAVVTMYRKA
jgi:acetyl-CoA acetyltransferase